VSDLAPQLEQLFAPGVREESYVIDEVEGQIPAFLRGTYYLNGPARFESSGLHYSHWLDGDGMVCALHFGDGGVRFTNRFVRTRKFLDEEEAGRAIYRTFGTAFPGNRLRRGIATESPANVSVYRYGQTLLAFGENSLPYEVDPATLGTRGPFNFGGQLNEVSPFGAHPKIAPGTGELFNFGVSYSAAEPCLTLYRFDGRGQLVYRRRVALPYPCSVHDFSLSPTFVVFYLAPYLLDLQALLREGRTTLEALRWDPGRGSRLLVLTRENGEEVATIGIGKGYCLHHINSFEKNGYLTADVVEFERPLYDQYRPLPNLFCEVPHGQPVRFVVDVRGRRLVRRDQVDYRCAPDFPSIDPRDDGRPYDAFWMLGISATGQRGRKFFDRLVRASWSRGEAAETYRPPPRCYLGGEPVFLPGRGDGPVGVVVCQEFDTDRGRSAFALFDAFAVARGPMARLRLRTAVPPGFHASFSPLSWREKGKPQAEKTD
jgi:all-trans-8'-apo-beta-carotenal 15,15'-oxygenase